MIAKANMKRLFDVEALRRRCEQSIDEIMAEGVVVENELGRKHSLVDRGGRVLVVAHCDFVEDLGENFSVVELKSDTLVFCPKLDDRLGVYLALDFLPRAGIVADVLLTEDEEVGRSTAEDFVPNKAYNWIAGLDRRGTDVVVYQYLDPEFEDLLFDYFESVGGGTFSDISSMERLGIKAFNLGIGFSAEHSEVCHCSVGDCMKQMERFISFHEDMEGVELPHDPGIWEEEWVEECALCGVALYPNETTFCSDCVVACGLT